MTIAGLQKMTLLDYPSKVACTVFLQGCNFRCPFCHNSDLLGAGDAFMAQEELFTFLKKRQGLLDGVCISGGEPTLHGDLAQLAAGIKALGFLVKLDTNGSRPQLLEQLVSQGLVDYVAMDIKNAPDRYADTAGCTDLSGIEQSIRFLLTGSIPYEFRTTVVAELHDEASMLAMGQWLHALAPEHKAKQLFLQSYVDRESVLQGGLHAPSRAHLEKFAELLRPFVEVISIRGVD